MRKQIVRPSNPDAAPQQSAKGRINWERINIWFVRVLGLGWLVLGLFAWAVILDIDPGALRAFESRAPTFQAVTIYFAVVDLLAAVGLWLLAPWGGVVWLIAAVSRPVMGFVFPAAAPLSMTGAASFTALIICYMLLSWLAGHRHRN